MDFEDLKNPELQEKLRTRRTITAYDWRGPRGCSRCAEEGIVLGVR
jgi:hypothetical protein